MMPIDFQPPEHPAAFPIVWAANEFQREHEALLDALLNAASTQERWLYQSKIRKLVRDECDARRAGRVRG